MYTKHHKCPRLLRRSSLVPTLNNLDNRLLGVEIQNQYLSIRVEREGTEPNEVALKEDDIHFGQENKKKEIEKMENTQNGKKHDFHFSHDAVNDNDVDKGQEIKSEEKYGGKMRLIRVFLIRLGAEIFDGEKERQNYREEKRE